MSLNETTYMRNKRSTPNNKNGRNKARWIHLVAEPNPMTYVSMSDEHDLRLMTLQHTYT
jgi:hypothetical protein